MDSIREGKRGFTRRVTSLLVSLCMVAGLVMPVAEPLPVYAGEIIGKEQTAKAEDRVQAEDSEQAEDAGQAEEAAQTDDEAQVEEAALSGEVDLPGEVNLPGGVDLSGADDSRVPLTIMVYGVGSNLERESFALTEDLVEMVDGMIAAKKKAGLSENASLPVHVIVETGGVSFKDGSGISEDRIRKRIDERSEIDADASLWKKYDDKVRELAADASVSSQRIFRDLTTCFPDKAPGKSTESDSTLNDLREPIDWTKNQRYELIPGRKLAVSGNEWKSTYYKPAINQVKTENAELSMTEVDSDGVATELYDFVSTTMVSYPADQYALILWDHGGKDGFGSDERTGTDGHFSITSADIKKTLGKVKTDLGDKWKSFAFAGYDACLLGDYDTITAWDGYTRYLIASEDTEGWEGWYYIRFIETLCEEAVRNKNKFTVSEDMAQLSLEVGAQCVNDFVQWFSPEGVSGNGNGTLGVFDLGEGRFKTLNDAVNKLSRALTDGIELEPFEAYTLYFNARKRTKNFNGIKSAHADLYGFVTSLKAQCESRGMEEEGNKWVKDIHDAAAELAALLEDKSNGPVRHFGSAGTYTANGEPALLRGMTITFPYTTDASEWNNWFKKNKDTADRTAYKDFNGIVASITHAAGALKEAFNKPEQTEAEANEYFKNIFNTEIEQYGISGDVKQELSDVKIAETLYKERIRRSDVGVLKIGGDYYSRNGHWEATDRIYQHGSFAIKAFNSGKDTVSRNILSLGLGYLPDGGYDDESTELVNYGGKEKNWFYISDGSGNDYPVSIFESFADDNDAFNEEAYITVPAIHFIKRDDNSFIEWDKVLIDVVFEKGQSTGKLLGYRTYSSTSGEIASRYYPAKDIDDKFYIIPMYDYEENMDYADGASLSYKVLQDKTDQYIQTKILLSDNCIKRGELPDQSKFLNLIVDRYPDLPKEAGEEYSCSLDNSYQMRDVFSYEYPMSDTATEPKKATVMLYGIGSDLERKSHRLSYDMTEIVAGLTAAWEKLVSENKITVNDNLPINVIAETGGVSYGSGEQTGDRILGRMQNQWDINDKYNNSYDQTNFAKYDATLKEITKREISSYEIFKDLTYTVSGARPTESNRSTLSEDRIRWNENQRFELSSGFSYTEGPDKSTHYILEARNNAAITDANRTRSMTVSAGNGVNEELYDFVSTTMDYYPAEQYILIFWDHGGGALYGFGSDERAKDDTLDSYNVEQTFSKLEDNIPEWSDFAFVDYDACLMSNLETAEAWSDYSDFLVGSEDNAPGDGQYFIPWICELAVKAAEDNLDRKTDLFASSKSMAEITKAVSKINIDSYKDWYGTGSKATLALMDLRRDDNARGPIQTMDDKMSALSGALLSYLEKDPIKGFSAIFSARKYGQNMSSFTSGIADVKNFAAQLKMDFAELAEMDPVSGNEAKTVSEAAAKLLEDFPDITKRDFAKDKYVLYHQESPHYGEGIGEDTQPLGGISMFFPFIDGKEKWSSYLKLYRKLVPGTTDFRDLAGTYLSIFEAGKNVKVIYDDAGKYEKDVEVDVIRDDLKENLGAEKGFGVTEGIYEKLKNLPELLYDEAPKESDLDVYKIEDKGETYYQNLHADWKLLDGYYQHGNYHYTVSDGSVKELKLGYLSGGYQNGDREEEARLYNYGTDNWIFVEYQTEEGKKVYPAAVLDSFTEDATGNTMQDEMYMTIPVEYLIKRPGKDGKAAYSYVNEILLDVTFAKGEKEGEILQYQDFDIENPDGASRFYSMEPLDDNDMMLPVYNVYETKIDTAQKVVRMYKDGEPDASEDLGVLVEPLPINKIRVFRGKGPEGWEKALAEEILDDDAPKDSYGLDTPYIIRDVFQSEYNLTEKTKMALDIRYKQDRDNRKPRLPEGREITPSDFEPVVLINGEEAPDETAEFGEVIMENLLLETEGRTVSFNGKYTLSANDVSISIKDDLSDYRKLVKGYDTMTEEQKKAVDDKWKQTQLYPSIIPLTITVEKQKVSPEDEHSAMDSVMKLKPWDKESEAVMTMVKGQSYTFGSDKNGNWTTSDKKKLSVGNKKTGKVTAKAATEEDKPVILKDSVSGKEYHIVIVAPKIYERVEDGENQVYDPVKSLTLLTGKYRELCILSDDTKAPKDLPLKPVWISSNPRIVTADKETGRITGVAKGSAKVSAYLNGKAWSCTVKVTDVFSTATGNPKKLGLYKAAGEESYTDKVCMNPGTALTLKYDKKSGFDPKKAVWVFKDENGNAVEKEDMIIGFDYKKAKVTANREGTVELWGYGSEADAGTEGKAPAVKLVIAVEALSAKTETYLNDPSTVKKAPAEQLKFYKVNNKKAVSWNSTDTETATVDADKKPGKVTAKAVSGNLWGVTDITCRHNGVRYCTTVYVEKPEVLTLDSRIQKDERKADTYNLTMDAGTRFLIEMPGVKQDVVWKSAKPSIAFVNENGVIEARAAGKKTTVTTKINGKTIKINVTVR